MHICIFHKYIAFSTFIFNFSYFLLVFNHKIITSWTLRFFFILDRKKKTIDFSSFFSFPFLLPFSPPEVSRACISWSTLLCMEMKFVASFANSSLNVAFCFDVFFFFSFVFYIYFCCLQSTQQEIQCMSLSPWSGPLVQTPTMVFNIFLLSFSLCYKRVLSRWSKRLSHKADSAGSVAWLVGFSLLICQM